MTEVNGSATESTPLLLGGVEHVTHHVHAELPQGGAEDSYPKDAQTNSQQNRRPSMLQVQKRVLSFVKDTKANCDEFGPCFGYSDPCGGGCFKHITGRPPLNANSVSAPPSRKATFATLNQQQPPAISDVVSEDDDEEEAEADPPSSLVSPMGGAWLSRMQSRESAHSGHGHSHHHQDEHDPHDHHHHHSHEDTNSNTDVENQQHHHHVPTNAFLSIGLQTVIAIALHKFPEGFITFATNHASRSLGFSVFMALFVHNIAEGFAMALPLYMALGSRLKAILWSSLLGGLSQPLGAGVAVLWFKLANLESGSIITIDNTAYGALFAATAGIMTSVALQLFTESLSLNHDRNLSILFAFLGMILLGFSNSLVKD